MRRWTRRTGWWALALWATIAEIGGAEDRPEIDFTRQIRPLLASKCWACHGPDEGSREAGLRLDVRETATAELESGERAIVPGDVEASELLARVTSEDALLRMPPEGEPLGAEQVALLKDWITAGADYAEHWSFVPPRRPALPAVEQADWPAGWIDSFVLSRMEAAGLQPSPKADRETLIRRLSLDLRGLPATLAEVDEFLADEKPGAYERLIDRMLADPAYGERWARMWLDLARYADSKGYGSDPLREIWRYRDWVIDAYNRNLPFAEFTIEQLAGDLLPGATLQQKIATAMHRNTMTNTEGGTDDEEFRVAAVKDRVDTTMQVWMGLTMGCAQCHNHKYDPLTQVEYYRFYALFNQTADSDRPDESPRLAAPTQNIEAQKRRIDALVARAKEKLATPTPELAAEQAKWEASLSRPSSWTVLVPNEAKSRGGAELSVQRDHSIVATGKSPDRDTYEVSAVAEVRGITAVRLETLPSESLPGGGAGRSEKGNFVVTGVRATAADADAKEQRLSGRRVRVQLPGEGKMLSLAEVQVFSDETNVAPQGKARQSSTAYNGPAELAIDGNTNGDYFKAMSTTHTDTQEDPWWEVDLGAVTAIDGIVIFNRTDGGTGARLANFRVSVMGEDGNVVWSQQIAKSPDPHVALAPSGILPVPFAQALADEQDNRAPADNVLAGQKPRAGWSASGAPQQPHALYLIAAEPISVAERTQLNFVIEQESPQPQHTLGRFRLAVATDDNVRRRLQVPREVLAIVDTPNQERSAQQKEKLASYYRSIAPSLDAVRKQIAELEKSRPEVPTVPVMQELPAGKQRKTHVMVKGNFLEKGQEVTAGVPGAFPTPSEREPQNRLDVARWLVDPANPLTARVAVNRLWGRLFGRGIVGTEEDFGTQGELPSHPQLLDYLALEFIEGGWDQKRLLRQIVTSRTYRQTSRVTEDRLQSDPDNRWLSRAPRFRLEAEMVRDQALALAGLLSRKLHGPSVYPPQPEGLWRAAFNGRDRTWATDQGEDRYRRGLYTFWRRTVPYPSMAAFDAPSREICTVRRLRTNTPLQAFVTLNDPVYVEAAQALARRILRQGNKTTKERIGFALRLCLGRSPQPPQVEALTSLYEDQTARYAADPKSALAMATEPLGPLPEDFDAAETAAWTVIANVLLNMDAVLTRR